MTTEPSISNAGDNSMTPELFQRIKEGDHAAFGILVRNYQSYAYGLAMRFVWDRQEAEDIVQESFIKVWHGINSYQPDCKFTTWLYAIVTRLGIDRIRSQKRWRKIVMKEASEADCSPHSEAPTPEERLDTEQRINHIRALVQRLPRKQRLIFTLRDLQDLSMDEIVSETGMSSTTVKANLWHARKRMKEMMEHSRWLVGS
jgi:RNA polymerase sigma-70 factor, ECF subfamily